MANQCSTCEYVYEYPADSYQCRRNLPKVADWNGEGEATLFPPVESDGYCWHYKEA